MSGVVVDEEQIAEGGLVRVTPTTSRAFLVEEFNRILIDRIDLPDFQRGIEVFEEKDNLLPFEEGYRDLDHEGASGREACRLADLQP